MGDRGNIKVTNDVQHVYLYTHWSGSDLPTTVQTALRKRQRWDDEQYLARILFCQLVRKDDWEGETGYGIGTVIGDGEDKVVEVDVGNQMVTCNFPHFTKAYTFEEFVAESTKFPTE